MPKTGISQGTKNRKEKESRYELREGIKRGQAPDVGSSRNQWSNSILKKADQEVYWEMQG